MSLPQAAVRWLRGGVQPLRGSDEIKSYVARQLREQGMATFFETGTFRGATLSWVAGLGLVRCYSVEYRRSYRILANIRLMGRAKIIGGSSDKVMQSGILGTLKQPVLFWLDAHWWGGNPLAGEIRAILDWNGDCMVMVDDYDLPEIKKTADEMLGLPTEVIGGKLPVGVWNLLKKERVSRSA